MIEIHRKISARFKLLQWFQRSDDAEAKNQTSSAKDRHKHQSEKEYLDGQALKDTVHLIEWV